MARWLLLLGGPLIWAAHFAAIYLAASIAEQTTGETGFIARAIILGAGALAVVAALGLLWAARRLDARAPLDHFSRIVASAGALIAIIAALWQSLPALAPI